MHGKKLLDFDVSLYAGSMTSSIGFACKNITIPETKYPSFQPLDRILISQAISLPLISTTAKEVIFSSAMTIHKYFKEVGKITTP